MPLMQLRAQLIKMAAAELTACCWWEQEGLALCSCHPPCTSDSNTAAPVQQQKSQETIFSQTDRRDKWVYPEIRKGQLGGEVHTTDTPWEGKKSRGRRISCSAAASWSSGWPCHECALDDNCKGAYLVRFITKGMPLHLIRACSYLFSCALADFFVWFLTHVYNLSIYAFYLQSYNCNQFKNKCSL